MMPSVEIPLDLVELCQMVMAWRRAQTENVGRAQGEMFKLGCMSALGDAAWRCLEDVFELAREAPPVLTMEVSKRRVKR